MEVLIDNGYSHKRTFKDRELISFSRLLLLHGPKPKLQKNTSETKVAKKREKGAKEGTVVTVMSLQLLQFRSRAGMIWVGAQPCSFDQRDEN